jgi:hypothetical protein
MSLLAYFTTFGCFFVHSVDAKLKDPAAPNAMHMRRRRNNRRINLVHSTLESPCWE